jgi:hypothetical protein
METPRLRQETELVRPTRIGRQESAISSKPVQLEKEESLNAQGSTVKSVTEAKPSILDNLIIENTAKKALDNTKAGINQIHEQKEPSEGPKPNFHFHGEDFLFAKKSLFCMDEKNKARLFLIKWMTHR